MERRRSTYAYEVCAHVIRGGRAALACTTKTNKTPKATWLQAQLSINVRTTVFRLSVKVRRLGDRSAHRIHVLVAQPGSCHVSYVILGPHGPTRRGRPAHRSTLSDGISESRLFVTRSSQLSERLPLALAPAPARASCATRRAITDGEIMFVRCTKGNFMGSGANSAPASLCLCPLPALTHIGGSSPL